VGPAAVHCGCPHTAKAIMSRPAFPARPPAGQTTIPDSGGSAGALTVALLDEDMILRLSVEAVFESCGLRLISGSSPAALLDALRSAGCAPDVLVADDLRGWRDRASASVPDLLATLGRDLPVIITTGDESRATQAEIRDAGWHYLSKPYDPESLQALILSVLGQNG